VGCSCGRQPANAEAICGGPGAKRQYGQAVAVVPAVAEAYFLLAQSEADGWELNVGGRKDDA
jgi:hypothetical protein